MLAKTYIGIALPLLLLLARTFSDPAPQSPDSTGTLEKMIATNGTVTIDVDLARLGGVPAVKEKSRLETVDFGVASGSFFTILVFNDNLRTALPGTIDLVPQHPSSLARFLGTSFKQLVVERLPFGEAFELVVRDGKSGFVFFNIEGDLYDYDPINHLLNISGGRLLISDEFATKLGRIRDARTVVGNIWITTTMDPIEVTKLSNSSVQSVELPAAQSGAGAGASHRPALVSGPDVIVGDLPSLIQSQTGSANGRVGLALATTSCNNGDQPLDWMSLQNNSNDHPVIPQNLYRMSGGTTNSDRFEQIGQSWLKHAYLALEEDACSFGCVTTGCTTGTHLCKACSDPYSASLNGTQSGLGSRAWVNPFTGAFPVSPNPASHAGHSHDVTSHRILVDVNDLNTTLNTGATYYGEGQYVTPHEWAWCQTHPGQCNMYNNVSYRRFTVTGTSNFTFASFGATVQTTPAIYAWTGATVNLFEPDPGNDGIGYVAYKVTNPTAGVWHYEYAVYNENLDRAIQSFSVPLGCGVTASNVGFHQPPQHPAWANDGTLNNAGYSSSAWVSSQTASALGWSCETFAQNQNANAIRWGTLYNFRFDSNRPPQSANASLGFFKTGAPITVTVQAPAPDACAPMNLVTAVSRKTHGPAGSFDINLPLSGTPGVECRSSGGNQTLVFTFSNTVVSGSATLTVGSGSVSGNPIFSSNTMTVNLVGVTDPQNITVTLDGVTDNFSQVLPSTPLTMGVLPGDTNADSSVNSADVGQTKSESGNVVTSANFREDVNVDGDLNSGDVGLVKSKSGTALP